MLSSSEINLFVFILSTAVLTHQLRTSGTNCTHIYSYSMHDSNANLGLPAEWSISLELEMEDAWNGFNIYALILEHKESGSALELPHNVESQAARFDLPTNAPQENGWNWSRGIASCM